MMSFFVPARNEEANIAATLEAISSAAKEAGIGPIQIIVINDGSTDRTGEVVQGLLPHFPGAEVITHPVNMGMSACIKDALAVARYDRCLFVPGDNDLQKSLLFLLLKNWRRADMVLFFPINSENRSYFRNLLSYLFRIIYMMSFQINVNYVNGPCIYTTSEVRKLKIRSRRFSIISEINTKLLRKGATFCEIPGYFQTGSRPTGTVSVRNLLAVCESYFLLLGEIHLFNRAEYRKRPRRVFIDFLEIGKS